MLSGILRSRRAVEVNIGIMRAFVRLREMLASNEELARKVAQHDRQIAVLFDEVEKLLELPEPKKNPIGFIHPIRRGVIHPYLRSRPRLVTVSPLPAGCRREPKQAKCAGER